MRRVRQKFAEMEMNQHFGKTLATHFHVINTTQDSHTSNHNKLHTYIKPQASHIYTTSFHKLHIYDIIPQASHTQ